MELDTVIVNSVWQVPLRLCGPALDGCLGPREREVKLRIKMGRTIELSSETH